MCHSCYLKNQREGKRDRDGNKDEKLASAKLARSDENSVIENANADVAVDEVEVLENANAAEKEGAAISVLLCLSKL